MLHAVATSAATFTAVNVQHVELADQISEKMIAPSRGITHRHIKKEPQTTQQLLGLPHRVLNRRIKLYLLCTNLGV
jgi:hypothetical protein